MAVLFLFIILNFTSFNQLSNLKSHYSLKQFQPKNHPILTVNDIVKEQFLIPEASPYVVSLSLDKNQGLWTQPDNIEKLHFLTDKFTENESILSVASLSNIETAIVEDDRFTLASIRTIASTADSTLNNPLLSPHVVSEDGKHAAIIVTPDTLSSKKRTELLHYIEKETQPLNSNITVQIGGPSAIITQTTDLLTKEVALFTLFSLALAILILSFIFKGFVAPIMCLGVVLSANIIAMSLLAIFGIPLTLLSNTVPILITITVVAITTHSLSKISELQKNSSLSKKDMIYGVFKELLGPHLLTAITTAIGFGTLISSDVPIISNYGLSVACCVLLACLVTLTMLPTLLLWLPLPQKRQFKFSPHFIISFLIKFKKPIFISICLTAISLAVVGKNLNWSALLFDDLPESHKSRQATLFADKHLGGTVPLHLSITGTDKMAWRKPENIRKLDALVEDIRESHLAGSVIGLSDFIKTAHPSHLVPTKQKTISETYFVYGMSEDNPLDTFLTPNGLSTRLSIRMQDIPSMKMKAHIETFKKQAQAYFPEKKINVSGAAATIHTINEELSMLLMFGFFKALLWIVLLLSIVFRSLSWALISVVPNMLPPIFLLGVLAITKTPIKPGIAIIFAISLGIAFDNTVYILSRLKQLLKQKSGTRLPVRRLLRDEMGPCFVSSFCLMAGFSIFVFSYFTVNKIFGAFMILSISAGLIGDLVLLPILLVLFPRILHFSFGRATLKGLMRLKNMLPIKKITTAALITASLIVFSSENVEAKKITAEGILSEIQKNNTVPNEKAEIKMIIKERDGSTKERHIIIKKKNGSEKQALVKLLKPADLKGVGLLSKSKGKTETQWIYLPSEKRPRRIVSSNKNGRFLDSDLSYEDLSVTTYQNFNNSIEKSYMKGGRKVAILLSRVKDKNSSSYGKIKTWVDTSTYRILRSSYFNHKGKLVKKMRFKKYKKYGKVWRARTITVENIKKKRSTTLQLQNVSLKSISPGELSMSALEEG